RINEGKRVNRCPTHLQHSGHPNHVRRVRANRLGIRAPTWNAVYAEGLSHADETFRHDDTRQLRASSRDDARVDPGSSLPRAICRARHPFRFGRSGAASVRVVRYRAKSNDGWARVSDQTLWGGSEPTTNA